ncbi:MAG: transglycosylase SLT domain-containing protein [Actinomycetota bacterium]
MLVLSLCGLQAGLAAGSLRAGPDKVRLPGAEPLAASSATGSTTASVTAPAADTTAPAADTPTPPAATPAADALATAEVPAPRGAASAPLPAEQTPTAEAPPAASPAAAIVPADRLHLEPILADAARQYDVPVDMILAQAWAESSWKVDAVSHKGAVGVLQIMPDAVDFISKRLLKLDQPLNALDPAENARMGARFMRHLLDRLDGDMRQALIAYNQGLAGLRRYGPYPAAESYADKVLALRPVFAGQI